MDRETWLLWLLADSQLPTGGFVASAGLEAALQAGLINEGTSETEQSSFVHFIRTSAHNQAHFALPFCSLAHEQALHLLPSALSSETSEEDTIAAVLDRLQQIDNYHQAMLSSNSVAMRASVAQGGGLLSLFNRGYAHARFMDDAHGRLCAQIAKRLQRMARLGEVRAHWPVVFGFVCAATGISIEHAQQLFMFQFVRQIFSAAIRLNLVGPLHAQALQCDMHLEVADLLHKCGHLRPAFDTEEDVFGESAVYTDPILELYQGMHDRLYSRIFNS
ncbi:hypothetical protein LPJ78_001376 [Coemansia sp. RSA 989]|nr:hypothetical protein LPJ68_000972 [Coemansia sp. RSA 1086]KAJ1752087.1 hypothetical protein LPJ79_001496 [Coemansia sp. RSA 1821]KAJ1866952.1 hypothetical protein LPJ78_001376 [Coemansia sp. RSA 989]KAJ1874185.1 hypothetical protein LPJ55_001672 [Coemansia sp. RSA 990]KAJ2670844.1 hypothetical protein IWW42_003713 [Coemansia sp. RSA 1085]